MEQLNKRIEIYESKIKLAVLIIFTLPFSIIGIFMLALETFPNGDLGEIVFHTICFIFLSIWTIICIVKLFSKKPLVIIDEIGIINNTNKLTADMGYIQWAKIEKLSLWSHQLNRFIFISIKEPCRCHMNPLQKVIIRICAKLKFLNSYGFKYSLNARLVLDATLLDMNDKEIRRILEERLSEYKRSKEYE